MQLARQTVFKSEKPARVKKSGRAGTIAAIHIVWKKLRPDLRHDVEGLRAARLDFMNDVLKPKRLIESMRDVSEAKLGKVLDAMRELERAPLLPGAQASSLPAGGSAKIHQGEEAGIHHLATEAQVAVISKLFLHLGWTLESIEGFTFQKFKRKSHRMITPKQANSLTMILLTIAAARDIKRRWLAETGREVGKVSREMIRAEIPQLKRRLEIDQKPSADYADEESADEEFE